MSNIAGLAALIRRRAELIFWHGCEVRVQEDRIIVMELRRVDRIARFSHSYNEYELREVPVEDLARCFILDATRGLYQAIEKEDAE